MPGVGYNEVPVDDPDAGREIHPPPRIAAAGSRALGEEVPMAEHDVGFRAVFLGKGVPDERPVIARVRDDHTLTIGPDSPR